MLFSRAQKIKNITKIEQKKLFFFLSILRLTFYGVSGAKTNLYSKYINFVFSSFFEQYHLLNLFILGAYAQR